MASVLDANEYLAYLISLDDARVGTVERTGYYGGDAMKEIGHFWDQSVVVVSRGDK